jgi:GGDEF domain-containing protein
MWFILAIGIGLFGFFRQLPMTLLGALIVAVLYSGSKVYQVFFSESISYITWNDVIWLFIFPFAAIIGNLNRAERLPRLRKQEQPEEEQELEPVQATSSISLQPSSGLEFPARTSADILESLDEVVTEGLDERFTFNLIFIEIRYFAQFYQEYGREQAQQLLDSVASMINEVIPTAKLKAYMDKGLFAVAATSLDSFDRQTALLRLDNKFESMLLSRSRKDGFIRVRLNYGQADFPVHGLDAKILLGRAAQELHDGQVVE